MNVWLRNGIIAWTIAPALSLAVGGGEARVLATDRVLDGLSPFPPRPLVSWQWTPEQKQQAGTFSRTELIRDSSGEILCSLRVSSTLPFKRPYLEVLNLGIKYLPPEADAIRLKIKAISGRCIVGFGGPTAYFGNSDAFLRPLFIDHAKDGPEWKTVECSLHQGLFRNFRRSSFSTDAPWIYYARWTQEPTFLYVYKGSNGEIQFKDVQIISRGLARPFASPGPEPLQTIATLADFRPASTGSFFTALIADTAKELAASWDPAQKLAHPPADICLTNDPAGQGILKTRGRYLEEMSAVGIKVKAATGGNGLQFRMKIETQATNMVLPAEAAEPVDILLYAASDPATFDWGPFLTPAELRGENGTGKGYDMNLSYEKLRTTPGLSLAIYHARRFVPKGQWRDLVIPCADFLCLYGCGAMSNAFQRQGRPDPGKLVAIAILAPWPRRGRHETGIELQDIRLVNIAGGDGSGCSYYQYPEAEGLKLIKSPRGKYAFQLAPGETALPPELQEFLQTLD